MRATMLVALGAFFASAASAGETEDALRDAGLYAVAVNAVRTIELLCAERAVREQDKQLYYDCAERWYNPIVEELAGFMPGRVDVDGLQPIKR